MNHVESSPGETRRARWTSLLKLLKERNLVMGVLNTTPDSFSDGGCFLDPAKAIDRALEMEREGADLIDVGGESSRPGAEVVSVEEELARVVPVIEGIRQRTDVPVSIDSYKLEVVQNAFSAGADIVNDITAATQSPLLPRFVGGAGGGMILMHMRGNPEIMQQDTTYSDLVMETRQFLQDQVEFAVNEGLPRDSIWIDPGIGFGKSLEGNLEILANLREYDSLGLPLVVGLSRKSFIGKILDRTPDLRLHGTLGLTGALASDTVHRVHRVHDVSAIRDCLRSVEALNGKK